MIFTKTVNLYIYIHIYKLKWSNHMSHIWANLLISWERNRHYPSNWQFVWNGNPWKPRFPQSLSWTQPRCWDVAGDGYVHSISAHQKTQASRRFRKWNQCERLPTLCKDFADFFWGRVQWCVMNICGIKHVCFPHLGKAWAGWCLECASWTRYIE